MKSSHSTSTTHFYHLQPRDGSQYYFFFVPMAESCWSFELDKENNVCIQPKHEPWYFSSWGRGTYLLALCIYEKTYPVFLTQSVIEHWADLSPWRIKGPFMSC